MPFRCKFCLLKFTTKKLLAEHCLKRHSNTVRCALCFLRFSSTKILNLHYIKKHSKLRITKQLINYSLHCSGLGSVHPFNWIRTKKRNKSSKEQCVQETEKLYIKENIHITYGNKEIIIELSSDNEESLELSIDNIQNNKKKSSQCSKNNKSLLKAHIYDDNANCILEEVKPNEKLVILPHEVKRNKSKKKVGKSRKYIKRYKHFCLEFVKPNDPKSLDHKTGQFYICNCDKKEELEVEKEDEIIEVTSDTESSSDNGKYAFYPIIDKKLYCTICGNGYRTKSKLLEHRKLHSFHCRICGTYYTTQRQYMEHLKNHIPVFCCHMCSHEFSQKLTLINHLSIHQEQEILKNVLEMEQNYSHYLINFHSESYAKSINNITSFLTQSCDNRYNQNVYKIRCQLCYLDFFKCDFEQHLKMHYYFKNSSSYFSSSIEYPRI